MKTASEESVCSPSLEKNMLVVVTEASLATNASAIRKIWAVVEALIDSLLAFSPVPISPMTGMIAKAKIPSAMATSTKVKPARTLLRQKAHFCSPTSIIQAGNRLGSLGRAITGGGLCKYVGGWEAIKQPPGM
ncbi:MAG: hypothetical protein NTV93_13430 [Verrucomicrobia bacterium]|nr:hypothetical protein [Verrucomicrobiota bacterium]